MTDFYTLFAANEDGEKPSAYEAETVHDFIQEMMAEPEYWQNLPAMTQQAMLVARDTLCWALAHEDNPSFGKNIRMWSEAYADFMGQVPRFDS